MPKRKKFEDVPIDEVGECVQLHIDAGAIEVTVTADSVTGTCTVVIEN